jgi:hypothetical protein
MLSKRFIATEPEAPNDRFLQIISKSYFITTTTIIIMIFYISFRPEVKVTDKHHYTAHMEASEGKQRP